MLESTSNTRRKIQQTAELLFADQGFDRVTLRQIARAAGQGNVAAVQYHFGSKEGLFEAIAETHREQIDERREQLLGHQAETEQPDRLASLLEILIVPLVEKLDTASGRAYLRIQAERLAHTEMRPATRALTRRIGRRIENARNENAPGSSGSGQSLPADHRDNFTILLLFHALADRARLEEAQQDASHDRKVFIESLNRAIAGLLRA